MNSILFIFLILWVVRIVHNILAFVQLWWVKEYRWDRMRIHLQTPQGKGIYFLPFRGFHISPKTVSMVCILLISLAWVYTRLSYPPLVRVFILDVISFPLTAIFVALIGIPQILYHKIIVYLATQKLRAHKKLFVIGITGSYGKTSTKEYLATILSTHQKVLKTQKSQNSIIGIAEVVLRELQPYHEIFVVEMGAYKQGEIAQMAAMVRPQVGIITAINEQHQDLFGSITQTMKAKYELLAGLTGKRIAIMIAGLPHMDELISWAKKDALTIISPRITDVIPKPNGLSFVADGDHVFAPVIGAHQAQNIALAISASVAAGMDRSIAVQAASTLLPVDKMMKLREGVNGSTFVDDTFNNNPDAAIAAIEYLSQTKGKKILVFQPMIELGQYAQSAHERVGKRAAQVCDEVILTNKSYSNFFGGHVYGPKVASDFIRKTVGPGDTVLFKGKEAARVLRLLV